MEETKDYANLYIQSLKDQIELQEKLNDLADHHNREITKANLAIDSLRNEIKKAKTMLDNIVDFTKRVN